MSNSDETDARITENIGRAARFLDEVFDDPSILDGIPAGAHILIADSETNEVTKADVAARMTAAGKPAEVYRLSGTRPTRRTVIGS
ncbi:MAG: hypothetical protein M3457_10440 [Chloroflexota bacterium]|nr:hypothetical protein [Chloroflexota bacterium]